MNSKRWEDLRNRLTSCFSAPPHNITTVSGMGTSTRTYSQPYVHTAVSRELLDQRCKAAVGSLICGVNTARSDAEIIRNINNWTMNMLVSLQVDIGRPGLRGSVNDPNKFQIRMTCIEKTLSDVEELGAAIAAGLATEERRYEANQTGTHPPSHWATEEDDS